MTTIHLIDYPAVTTPDMQSRIDAFLAACRSVQDAPHSDQRQARITLASSLVKPLMSKRDALEELIDQGDRWLVEHPDDDDETHWFAAESAYRAICDALDDGLTLAFGSSPTTAQAQMWGVLSCR